MPHFYFTADDAKPGFTFIWTIENHRYNLHEGQRLTSPVFTVNAIHQSKWTLSMLRKQYEDDYIDFTLLREEDSYSREIEIEFQLSILDGKGRSLLSMNKIKHLFERNGKSQDAMPAARCGFIRNTREYLAQDALTVSIRMWRTDTQLEDSSLLFARTRIQIERKSFIWSIEKFSSFHNERKRILSLQPSSSTLPNLNFTLSLAENNDDLHIEITQAKSEEKSIASICEIIVMNSFGREVVSDEAGFLFESSDEIWKFPLLITKTKLMSNKILYLPNDILHLKCICGISKGIAINQIDGYDSIISSMDQLCIDKEETLSSATLSEDLHNLFQNTKFSDIVLQAQTKKFSVHKNILCARSPVFSTMFTIDMKEKKSNCVELYDVDDETLQSMLLFIYTDSVGDLKWDALLKLYAVADKYTIELLKLKCTSLLKASLNTFNACSILIFADMHNDKDLKTFVQNFILWKDKEIFESDDWKALMEDQSILAMETMYLKCINE
ncbi:unnamed protein product [Larinioides sclopetarius]|uniref:Speckle-type POZ protein n=1 Tax=Larinioides sclopetarius TaxID=280406 RepID=A0AAV2ACZ1_9ARAC